MHTFTPNSMCIQTLWRSHLVTRTKKDKKHTILSYALACGDVYDNLGIYDHT